MNTKQKALHSEIEFDVDDFIDRLKEFTGCESDYQLSDYFNFKARNQFGQFRSRGSISSTGMETILNKMKGRVNFNWLLFGIGTPEMGNGPTEGYSEAFMTILKGLGFKTASPEARALTNMFVDIVEEGSDTLPPEAIQHEVNIFISELIKYVLNAPDRE